MYVTFLTNGPQSFEISLRPIASILCILWSGLPRFVWNCIPERPTENGPNAPEPHARNIGWQCAECGKSGEEFPQSLRRTGSSSLLQGRLDGSGHDL